MFIVQGISKVFRDPELVEQGEIAYDKLLYDTPGMYWNIYFQGIEDPSRTIHTQGWAQQATSEGFGVSQAFQAMRNRFATADGPRARMIGPLSPGYWEPIVDVTYQAPPTGYRSSDLGVATHGLVFVIPGREFAYEAAERAVAEALRGAANVFTFRSFINIGQPNGFTRYIHWRDAAAEEAARPIIAAAEAERQACIEEETTALYLVKLSSDWPDRRLADGV